MSNMSHCRFNNTQIDLEECLNAIEEQKIESLYEANKAKRMFEQFLGYCQDQGIIDGYDEDIVNEIIDDAVSPE